MSGLKPQTRHLVFDEVETFAGRHALSYQFRIRVWMGKNATTVVLVTPINDSGFALNWITKVANYVNSAILKYPENGMLFFWQEHLQSIDLRGNVTVSPVLDQILFEYIGHKHRLRLVKPIAASKSPLHLLFVLGVKELDI